MDNKTFIKRLIGELRFKVPYSPSQGEESYAIIYDTCERDMLVKALEGRTEVEVEGEDGYFFRCLPSSFNSYDYVVYKIRKNQ